MATKAPPASAPKAKKVTAPKPSSFFLTNPELNTTGGWASALITEYNVLNPTRKIPLTTSNIDVITAWIYNESHSNKFSNGSLGNWLRDNNPLNTGPAAGAKLTSYGGFSNYTYSTPLAGVIGTAKYLSMPNYSTVAKALHNDAGPTIIGAAIAKSPWASGHYVFGGVPASWDFAYNAGSGLASNKVTGTVAANDPNAYGGSQSLASSAGGAVPGLNISLGSWEAELATLLGDLTSAAWWKRVGIFTLGAALAIGGVVLFLESTKSVQAAQGAVIGVV